MDKRLYTLPEVLEALSLGRSKVYELIGSGELRPLRVGRVLRFRAEEVDAYVQQLVEEQFPAK